MLRLPLLAALFFALPAPQDPVPATAAPSPVSVPTYPNTTCPIMGKPISTKLYTDIDYGRIYICCKACIKDIRADPETAYKAAYPTKEAIQNTVCPITGKEIQKGASRAELQGREFAVCSADCVALARADAQVVLAKLADPRLVDVGNKTCPVTGEPVAANAFCVVDGHVVRLSSTKVLEDVAKDPAKALGRAKEIRKRQDAERNNQPDEDGQRG
jgi:hypothetical protein